MLTINNITLAFGGIVALSQVSFSLEKTKLLGIIGPNGAGKSTLFNVITGNYLPTRGTISYNDESLINLPSEAIVKKGIARTFQNIRLFKNLSVFDNVRLAFFNSVQTSLMDSLFRSKKIDEENKIIAQKVEDLLRLVHLEKRADQLAGQLSYGDQRRLEIIRALATNPSLLLLDEPAAGMVSKEKEELVKLIRHINEDLKITVLIIEHDMKVIMNLCPHIIVLDHGEMIAQGCADEIRKNPKVIEAYLGVDE